MEYILKSSLDAHRTVNIVYQKNNVITQRKVKILKIEDNYIEAYCYLRKQIRHFKKENILAAKCTH